MTSTSLICTRKGIRTYPANSGSITERLTEIDFSKLEEDLRGTYPGHMAPNWLAHTESELNNRDPKCFAARSPTGCSIREV